MGQSNNIIDEDALGRLAKLGGDQFAADMINMFFEYADGKLKAATEAADNGDIDSVEKAIHPLKTSAGHIGAIEMRDLSQEIEKLARTDDTGAIPDLVVSLVEAYSRAKPLLEGRREQLQHE